MLINLNKKLFKNKVYNSIYRMCIQQKRFYEMLKMNPLNQIDHPKNPQDAILSKYIKQVQQSKNKTSDEKMEESLSFVKWSKINKKDQGKVSYQELLNSSPYGSVQNFSYKNHNITLLSTNYYRVEDKKLQRLFFTQNPDVMLLQRRPQYYLHNFEILKKGSDGVFSDRQYLNQLKLDLKQIRLQSQAKKTDRPLLHALDKTRDDVLQKLPQKQILHEKGFNSAIKYISSYNTDLFLTQMPNRSYRQWLANTHTLMQLQQMFKNVCFRLPRYKNLNFSPYQMATFIYPEAFLQINDLYMATIIQMLIATKKYKKIVGLFGLMQNQAVRKLLQSGKGLQKAIIQLIMPPQPKSSLVRNIQNLQIIEKHILLDLFFYGENIFDIQTKYLHTTNQITIKYGVQSQKMQWKDLMKFKYEKTLEYQKIMKSKIKQGEQQIKKEFIRETLRNKQ